MVAQGLGQSERWHGPECMHNTYQVMMRLWEQAMQYAFWLV